MAVLQPEQTAGWDLGGAHLKLALAADGGKRLTHVEQIPCPLWRGIEHLHTAIEQVSAEFRVNCSHRVTMTGELVDLFPDRATGVSALVDVMAQRFEQSHLRIFAGHKGFISVDEHQAHAAAIASANWLASADFAAARVEDAIFVDIGSTTTDIIAVHRGTTHNRGTNDADRLASGELVYTGVTRTPICAIADRVLFRGEWHPLAAELFCTTADIYRILGTLPDGADQMNTADGRGKSVADSRRRLARMLGTDAHAASEEQWRLVAAHVAGRQSLRIREELERALSRNLLAPDAPLVGAGVGRFVVREIASFVQRPYIDFAELLQGDEKICAQAADCAPAAALALMNILE